jgi:hypothetical protein
LCHYMPTERNDSRGAERLGSANILVVVSTCRRDATTEFGVAAVASELAKAHK